MSKFNTGQVKAIGQSIINTSKVSTGTTHEGGAGFERDPKSELFLLGVTNFVNEKTFYEDGAARDTRFADLVHVCARLDMAWLRSFAIWLRSSGNIRTASLVVAAEAYRAGVPVDSSLVSGVCQRADEPGEIVAYWHKHYGKTLPVGLKRGLAVAASRLYTQNAALKYDNKDKAGVRFADVIALVHARPKDERQNQLFVYLMGKRKGLKVELGDGLKTLKARHDVTHGLVPATSAELLRAGMTWEALSGIEQGEWDAKKWESVIPSMGYMALLRNLANFDRVGVSGVVGAAVCSRLSDPAQVHMSKQLPMRFLSALRATNTFRWDAALEAALDASVMGIPEFAGRTLILVDTSGSMRDSFSKDGTLKRWDVAALFGLALARRCHSVDVVSYSSAGYGSRLGTKLWKPVRGLSLAKSLARWSDGGFNIGGGTDTMTAVKDWYKSHDRVVILTDEQAARGCTNPAHAHGAGGAGVGAHVPENVPLHTFNLAGYKMGHAAGLPNRYTYGGLTDAGFGMMKLVEGGIGDRWPWDVVASD